ncbi:hypothetical protein MMC07_000029 [Pseudocyphellaria aurata]|nr:hypothetical protein [Pseudocyphellaria aurata]
MSLEEDLKTKAKEREDLEELSNELELTDEDEKVPYVPIKPSPASLVTLSQSNRYKIGDTFFSLPLATVQELLSVSTGKIDEAVSAVETRLNAVRNEMGQLKVQLYARFGKSINLET